jgi:hypothetical protein
LTLYHGGYVPVEKPRITQAKYPKDFGSGFYCTHFQEQAVRWARRFDTPVVSKYHYDFDTSVEKKLKLLQFEEMTEEWLDFIVYCRSGREHDYDIVSGAMANDQVFNYISDFISGILTREQFWVLAKFKRPTHQISFCSLSALNGLSFLGSEEIKK